LSVPTSCIWRLFTAAAKQRFDLKLAYLSAIIYDLLFIPVYISVTGVFDSSFFLLYYLTVSVAAYVLTFWAASIIAVLATGSYMICILPDISVANSIDISMRVGLLWTAAGNHVCQRFPAPIETRLMKLFDTLNMRTSELEKSQGPARDDL